MNEDQDQPAPNAVTSIGIICPKEKGWENVEIQFESVLIGWGKFSTKLSNFDHS